MTNGLIVCLLNNYAIAMKKILLQITIEIDGVAGVAAGVLLEVVLVVFLGAVKIGKGLEGGDDGVRPAFGIIHYFNKILSLLTLVLVLVENGAPV